MEQKGVPYSGFIDDINVDDVPQKLVSEQSLVEVYLSETILSPTLQTTVFIQDTATMAKNYDLYKGKRLKIQLSNPNIEQILKVDQVLYRIENRKMINYQTEGYQLQACDDTLLENAKIRVSSFYQCASPQQIVSEALNCVKAKQIDFGNNPPANIRNYQPANIHPFQVVSEQADYSITESGDPSYLHFMTYRDYGTHHFKSLKEMATNPVVWTYFYNEKGANEQLSDPNNIMQYEFPCEFDLLSDIMNGLVTGNGGIWGEDEVTRITPSITAINPFNSGSSVVSNAVKDYCCGGIGGVMHASTFTNAGTHEDDGCETNVEQYLHLRPPRMALLQRDKISLKIIVPFNPMLHAGDKIRCEFWAKRDNTLDFGTGEYVIVSLSHNVKSGGYGITTLECVSRSVAWGEV